MDMRTAVRSGTVAVNGAEIYHEIRGSGPPVLMIVGATGDAGWYASVADLLARDYTVVTYDRRGNSRSSAPPGWTATSIQEQADDAAALLRAIDLAPAVAFGNSAGAIILLDLIVRHPEVLRAAIVHEPPTIGVLPAAEAEALGAQYRAMMEVGMARGGPREALRQFVEHNSGGAYAAAEPDLQERIFANAGVLFGTEIMPIMSFLPDVDALRRSVVPLTVLAGKESRVALPETYRPSAWLADQLGVELHEIPGAHVPYFDRPQAFVEAIRPYIEGAI